MSPQAPPSRILLQVGETLQVGSRSGIPRVVMKLARELAGRTPLDLIRWDALEGRLRFLDRHEFDHLFGRTAWPEGLMPRIEARKLRVRLGDEVKEKADVWVLQPEVPYHSPHGLQEFATWMTQVREYGWRTAAVIYDMIPLYNPAYAEARAVHLRYLVEAARADLLLPISRHSGDQLEAFARSHGFNLPTVRPVPLGESNVRKVLRRTRDGGSILALGTVEPRKRQVELVRAYAKGRLQSSALAGLELRIAGSLHPAVAREFEALVARTPGVRYQSYLPETEVEAAWDEAAFSVFASDDEGFGLPVAESLARGVPCIAVDKPPMTEIAGGAGVCRVASANPDQLCEALIALAEAPAERDRLRQEIAARDLRTWGDYAEDVLAAMTTSLSAAQPARPVVAATSDDPVTVQARADVVCFPDATARDAFVRACSRELAPGLLPSRLPIGVEADPVPSLAAFRGRLTHIASVERTYGQAMRALAGDAESRSVFLRIVVTTYNRRPFVLQNVRWLLDKVVRDRSDVELVVVDNASTDGSGEALRDTFQRRCRIIENAANVGMLGNMRVCSQLPGAEYVWLIGDDDFIVASQLDDILTALRANFSVPLAYLNFGVYYRQTLGALDTVEVLQAEGRPLAESPAPSGVYPLSIAAAQHDNLFTAIYINIWRTDVLAAAYDHPFDGVPFSNLVESIPCTKTLLESFGECEVYWHAPVAIIGNAHNSWVRHRPRWHARLMPEALALARDIGVEPDVLQGWADHQSRLYDEACELASEAGHSFNLAEPDALQLSWPLFRRRLVIDATR